MKLPAITPGTWKACRSHEAFDGPMWDIDPDYAAEYASRPFVRIEAEHRPVAAAHDLFEFTPADATAIAALPDLLAALHAVLPYIDDASDIAQFYPDSAASDACRTAVSNARAALIKAGATE